MAGAVRPGPAQPLRRLGRRPTRTRPVGRRARDERVGRHRRPNRRRCRRRRHRGRRRRRRGRVDVDRNVPTSNGKQMEVARDWMGRPRPDRPARPRREPPPPPPMAEGLELPTMGRRLAGDLIDVITLIAIGVGIPPARDGRVRRRAVRDLRRRLPRRDLPVRGPPRVAHRADARQADDLHDGRRPRRPGVSSPRARS